MSHPNTPPNAELHAVLSGGRHRQSRGTRVIWSAGIILVVVAVGAFAVDRAGNGATVTSYQTESIRHGTLKVTVAATGTLQPRNQVDVGSELSGLVEDVLVDDNDHVAKGQVLARLDTSRLEDSITKSQAALAAAEAGLEQARATVKESQANLDRYREVSRLSGGKVPSGAELTAAEAAQARAVANESSAKASVSEARASLSSDQINLSKASIRSPINGVVLMRNVEPGQTVAASLQVATLFTLAEDLREMELEVDVDEADVGSVVAGQPAAFTVDAYPERAYPAVIARVAYGSETTNNVVSYPALLTVKNNDLSLRPGMTASAEIVTAIRDGVWLVPNAALRFTPPASGTGTAQRSFLSRLMPGPPRPPAKQEPVQADGARAIWVLRNAVPASLQVTVGSTNGRQTEVSGPGLQDGLVVITDTLVAAK